MGLETEHHQTEPARFIVFECPFCGSRSAVCDQARDVARTEPSQWYWQHVAKHHPMPGPIIRLAPTQPSSCL